MAEVPMDFLKLSVTIDGRKEPIIKRIYLVATVAARKASVYTDIAVAELFRN